MTPLREWLNPPRSLLVSLFLLTLLSVSALGFFGWRLLEQERMVEGQRAQERLGLAADRITSGMREALAETGERVGGWAMTPPPEGKPEEGVLLLVTPDSFSAHPANRLLFRPSALPDLESTPGFFSGGEVIEFQQKQPDRAIEWYRQRLAESKNPGDRAGALVRIARVYRKSGRAAEARSAYQQLGRIAHASVAGVPADLVARAELCDLSPSDTDAHALREDLLRARWPLDQGQFEYYWSVASRLSGSPADVPAEPAALSQAVAQSWDTLERDSNPHGQSTMWLEARPYFLIWRGGPESRAILVTRLDSIFQRVFAVENVDTAAVDSDGRVVAGRKDRSGHSIVRTLAETQLPWALYFTETHAVEQAGMFARQRFLVLVTVVMAVFLIAGAFFIARAIRREMEVSRMQSDFVSAVSHEFRSPLTSIRQLSEILALGRIPSEGRRQVYYDTLVRESTRLQRLVEALLNFGRMEAGVRQYRFEDLDASTVVERVVADFQSQIAGSGRTIDVGAPAGSCPIDADPEALSVALRNLVDNALKYSPDCPTVWVGWGIEDQRVAIRVRDRGVGIAASERRAIFRKFVRGTAATAANVKGSGVGLAMVRHIVAAHGGEITVESEPGRGSTFTIYLPAGLERAKAEKV